MFCYFQGDEVTQHLLNGRRYSRWIFFMIFSLLFNLFFIIFLLLIKILSSHFNHLFSLLFRRECSYFPLLALKLFFFEIFCIMKIIFILYQVSLDKRMRITRERTAYGKSMKYEAQNNDIQSFYGHRSKVEDYLFKIESIRPNIGTCSMKRGTWNTHQHYTTTKSWCYFNKPYLRWGSSHRTKKGTIIHISTAYCYLKEIFTIEVLRAILRNAIFM